MVVGEIGISDLWVSFALSIMWYRTQRAMWVLRLDDDELFCDANRWKVLLWSLAAFFMVRCTPLDLSYCFVPMILVPYYLVDRMLALVPSCLVLFAMFRVRYYLPGIFQSVPRWKELELHGSSISSQDLAPLLLFPAMNDYKQPYAVFMGWFVFKRENKISEENGELLSQLFVQLVRNGIKTGLQSIPPQ